MPLNARGEILNAAADDKIAAAFRPLLNEMVARLRADFGAGLHSVYVYGSIAEGRARPGLSDADFIVAFSRPCEDADGRLRSLSDALLQDFGSVVSKIDTPHGTVAEILAPEQLYGWGAYLQILGLPLWGEDLRARLPAFRPGPELARGWNGDLRAQLAQVRQQLGGASVSETVRLQRSIAGTAIRALYMLLALDEWTTVFDQQARRVIAGFPAAAALLHALAAARRAQTPLPGFDALLAAFETDCLPAFEAGVAPG